MGQSHPTGIAETSRVTENTRINVQGQRNTRTISPTVELLMEIYRKELLRDEWSTGANESLSRDMENWLNIDVNIAVVGNSGTGKSSFINAIRGLKATDPGAAEVGVNETTVTCAPYKHPENERFIVWDIPGVGTPKFPKDTYLEKIRFDEYDFFIIISKSRFTENDLWLALEVQKRNKEFFFVRSNVDKDIEDDRTDDPENHDEEKIIQTIRKKTEDELKSNGVMTPTVFLINNRRRDKHDFEKLNKELLSSCELPPCCLL